MLKEKLAEIISVLDNVLGDTDPNLPEDMTDDEIRIEEPLFWAVRELNALVDICELAAPEEDDECAE